MEGHHHPHQHHQHMLQQQKPMMMGRGGHGHTSVDKTTSVGDNRFPQWSIQETREFLMVRAELDPNFMETKRNKLLWDVIATRMRDKGFNRSAHQCKCKWKNLVTRYKASEAMELEALRQQFPFYSELQAIFAGRMQGMLWSEADSGGAGSSRKKHLLLEEEDDHDLENGGAQEIDGGVRKNKRSKKSAAANENVSGITSTSTSNRISDKAREMLEELMRQQMQMDAQWHKAAEAREKERAAREAEWWSAMQALESEWMAAERRWREKEEARRAREEVRAEKRDALVTALINRLWRDDRI